MTVCHSGIAARAMLLMPGRIARATWTYQTINVCAPTPGPTPMSISAGANSSLSPVSAASHQMRKSITTTTPPLCKCGGYAGRAICTTITQLSTWNQT